MVFLFALAAAVANCPFPRGRHIHIAHKRDLPAGAAGAVGDMAERGEPFQVSDALGPDPLPFIQFVSAEGRGCDLRITYRYGGIAVGVRSALLRFEEGQWKRSKETGSARGGPPAWVLNS